VTADDRSYVAQLGAVLRRRDVAALRAFLEGQALHRMIVSRPDLAALHAESRRWLAGHSS
jgi:hypothetical protein